MRIEIKAVLCRIFGMETVGIIAKDFHSIKQRLLHLAERKRIAMNRHSERASRFTERANTARDEAERAGQLVEKIAELHK